jgi:hypothetical protein
MNIDIRMLENMKNRIESMSKNHQIEILKILKKNTSVKLNENKSGVYINLSFLPKETLSDLEYYMNYIHDQENTLQEIESQKNEFKNTFFSEKMENE